MKKSKYSLMIGILTSIFLCVTYSNFIIPGFVKFPHFLIYFLGLMFLFVIPIKFGIDYQDTENNPLKKHAKKISITFGFLVSGSILYSIFIDPYGPPFNVFDKLFSILIVGWVMIVMSSIGSSIQRQ